MNTTSNPASRFLRLPEVKRLTGLSRSTIYALLKSNGFPKPIPLGPRSIAWLESEIQTWIAEKVKAGRPE